jgi:L-amino acid N-acyltransferase YncA
MELIKLRPDSDEIDELAQVPGILFPDNMALQLESYHINREFLEHVYILKAAGIPIGCLAFYVNPGHLLHGESACCVGYFHCINDTDAVKMLIDAVKKDASALGIKHIIGPLNGTTWENYRFRTTEEPPSFFMETTHPVYYNDLFTAAGFYELKTYYSFLVQPLQPMNERALNRERQLLEMGVSFRDINPEKYAEDLRKIYDLCLICFKDNYLYTPYSWEAYAGKYKLLEGMTKPKMTVMAEHEGQLVGFVFMIDDYFCTDEKRVIFKTYAVHPSIKYAGLGAVISQRLIQDLMEEGYSAAIHAFVIEGSTSLNASSKDATIYRTYKLYALDVDQ